MAEIIDSEIAQIGFCRLNAMAEADFHLAGVPL
jgi:hypothetical protein